jgi:hypothetical protein
MRTTAGQQDDCLEQAGLAGRIRTVDEVRTGSEVELEGAVPPQVEEDESFEQGNPTPA